MGKRKYDLVWLTDSMFAVSEKTLRPLVGLRLLSVCRAVSLAMFGFGLASEPTYGEELISLHTESPWRLDGPEGVVTGKGDIWEPSDRLKNSPDFQADEWNNDQESLMDERAASLLRSSDQTAAQLPPTLLVREVKVDSSGSFELLLTEGYRLVIFIDGTQGEHWSFLSLTEGPDKWTWVIEDPQCYMIRLADSGQR